MIEDLADHGGFRNVGYHPEFTAASGAERDVDFKYVLYSLCPGEWCCQHFGRRDYYRARLVRLMISGLFPFALLCSRDDAGSQRSIGCQHTMVADEIVSGPGDQRDQFADEIEGREE